MSESNHDVETIKDMLWDWSHVRDSSDESFLAMAMEIDKWVSTEDKSSDSMLDFKIFVANYFQDLRREFDYYVNMNQMQLPRLIELTKNCITKHKYKKEINKMGFFSWNCKCCGKSIVSPYSPKEIDWMNKITMVLETVK